MAVILDGKMLSAKFREGIKAETEILKHKTGKAPGIAVILAGDDPASNVYVTSKERTAIECGFHSVVERVSANVTTEDILKLVKKFNDDDKIHGILVQLPLPRNCDEKTILRAIKPEKDVDGFHPYNVGLLNIGEDCLMPCTPFGVMNMLADYGIELSGKNAVVIGRSNIVGKPIAAMLLKANATVTICHSKTKNLAEICSKADILVAAMGRPKFVTREFIKTGAVVIDVGINRLDGKLCGDVDYDGVKDMCSFITPVPGGVGPMTITTLMQNTLKAFKMIEKL
ncbi:MAG: bifunctional methylenetetrahydrofolate dehydrogenase/methenyltetrahydrofolate cyclohydrolase FolD [Mucispirillum sp.]|uniref:Bifunctional protein FolD n=1 Tax=Candidatus Mucispirillum faecigallinarum TaxID=2838699 RepID=A0A9D2GVF9_9BACT|nr:bifunctional methylenetetrahydrofolate dehydrogenase/methenyltetrahydrofolate cyclohydrolase FolD [Mucispirillum sp.]HIZ90119.1 bifunctional methylenetetrahydrofolate dehydrogenase/methenyltetrahydrofolate cyclohydrolase FolD [Candidatus Mucispirillum faecigallinarum]